MGFHSVRIFGTQIRVHEQVHFNQHPNGFSNYQFKLRNLKQKECITLFWGVAKAMLHMDYKNSNTMPCLKQEESVN